MSDWNSVEREIRGTVQARLAPAEVASVEQLPTLPHSVVARVTLDDGRCLIFKRAGAAGFAPSVRKELIVNRDVLSQLPRGVAPAYVGGSVGDADGRLPWLLTADLSATHASAALATPPTQHLIEQFVDALACTHAQSTALDLPALFADVAGDVWVHDGAEHVPAVLDAFLHEYRDGRFPPRTYELIETIRDNVNGLARLLSQHAVLLHGDAHYGNALYREDGAVLLDWALAVIGPGEVDLCHALAMNLPRYFSSEYEPGLLRRYAAVCSEWGMPTSEQDVLHRYRTCLLLTVIVATGMRTVPGIEERVWSYLFTNAVHAAVDHESIELLR